MSVQIDDKYKLEFITPLFSYGADSPDYKQHIDGTPEIRAASIRGQLHHWLRLVGGDAEAERAIFGAVQMNFGGKELKPSASRIVVRVEVIEPENPATPSRATLPHKSGGPAASKPCFAPGTRFTLHVFERLGGIDTEQHRELARRAIEAWLLAGSLGLRATRGGGAFHWDGAPDDIPSYKDALDNVIKPTNLVFDILNQSFKTSEEARKTITDTLAEDAFRQSERPLGGINKPNGRKTSPLRLTVRRFGTQGSYDYRILALWDNRQAVTGNTIKDLHSAIDILAQGGKEIGKLLQSSTLRNTSTATPSCQTNPTPQIQVPTRSIRPPTPQNSPRR